MADQQPLSGKHKPSLPHTASSDARHDGKMEGAQHGASPDRRDHTPGSHYHRGSHHGHAPAGGADDGVRIRCAA